MKAGTTSTGGTGVFKVEGFGRWREANYANDLEEFSVVNIDPD
jgi:hypothetical protein